MKAQNMRGSIEPIIRQIVRKGFRLQIAKATVAMLAVLLCLGRAYGQRYRMIDLGTLGGNVSFAIAINDRGQVLGESQTFERTLHAFVWDAVSGMKDLGTLGGNSTSASAINNNGQIVGESSTSSDSSHAFLWDAVSGMRNLGNETTCATVINNAGQVAGYYGTSSGTHAFLWDPISGFRDVGTLGGNWTFPSAINNNGQVVGASSTSSGTHAFLWDPVSGMRDLGTLGGSSSYATAMNDRGQIVGSSYTPDDTASHAFVWDAGNGMTDLGALGGSNESYATAINDQGQVVGAIGRRAFVWDAANGMIDLGKLGELADKDSLAVAINDNGQVLVNSYAAARAFVWDEANGITDLGTLGPRPTYAFAINRRGEVVGVSSDHAFFAEKLDDNTPPTMICSANIVTPCSLDPLVPVTFAVTATDNSDTSPAVSCTPTSGSLFRVGTTTVICTATDASGNEAKCSFTVSRPPLGFVGFLAPIDGADANGGTFSIPVRTFKLNSTIPVKFAAACGGTAVLTGIHTLQAINWNNETTSETPIDATPNDAATTGNQFRLVGSEWHFNLDTKATGLTVGKWQLIATLSDGSQHSVWIQIK